MAGAEAFFRGTEALCGLVDHRVIPIRQKVTSQTPFQIALFGTYYRMQLWLFALEKLDHPKHFQPVLSAARGIYEMLLDLKLLKADPTNAAKFHEFAFLARYDVARKYVAVLNADPAYVRPATPEPKRAFIDDPTNKARFAARPPGNLTHWSGLDAAARAKKLGPDEEKRYRTIYSVLSWYVHPGAAGFVGTTADVLTAAFAWGHGTVQDLFAEAARERDRAE
jgi:hypothetical protein